MRRQSTCTACSQSHSRIGTYRTRPLDLALEKGPAKKVPANQDLGSQTVAERPADSTSALAAFCVSAPSAEGADDCDCDDDDDDANDDDTVDDAHEQ